jgi:hypothetical protein
MEEVHRAQEDYLEDLRFDQHDQCFSSHGDDQAAEWREELANRDPFEGSPF